MTKYEKFVPIVLFLYLLVSGFKIISPLPLTYDPALHAEIATYLIPLSLFPITWSPLADVGYTYPPLFHWAAFLFSTSGIATYKIVMLMGLLLYALFPVSFYLYGSAFGRIEAMLFSFFGAVQASLMEVFAAGEYPQLLSMNLAVIALYFLAKKDLPKAGLFAGFVVLSHSFTSIYLAVILAAYFLISRLTNEKIKSSSAAAFFLIFIAISSLWAPRYVQIAENAANSSWENTIWYHKAGFIGLEQVNNIFLSVMPGARMGAIFLILSLIGVFYAYKRKFYFQLFVFAFTVLFTVFHIPGTQYKFSDMLAIAVPPIASFGVLYFMAKTNKTKPYAKIIIAGFFVAMLLAHPYVNAVNMRNCCVSKDMPNSDEIKSAEWLNANDAVHSVIVMDSDAEAWFALIAGKIPLNPRVSELESFTPAYRQKIADRRTIINLFENSTALLEKWNVDYIVTDTNINPANFRLFHEEGLVKLYKRYV
ncbi:MAG: hypothetical protein V1836_03790 [Candidatus Aenigmatarchaeota archaeon]